MVYDLADAEDVQFAKTALWLIDNNHLSIGRELILEEVEDETTDESGCWGTPPASPIATDDPDWQFDSDIAEEERSDEETDEAEIEKIVTRRTVATGGWQYRVRWAGYGAKDDLWYTEENLRGYAPDLVEEYNGECEEAQISKDMAAMFEAFEKEAEKKERARRKPRQQRKKMAETQSAQTTRYNTRAKTRERNRSTPAEERAAASLGALLDFEPELEPEPEPEPELELEPEPELESEPEPEHEPMRSKGPVVYPPQGQHT